MHFSVVAKTHRHLSSQLSSSKYLGDKWDTFRNQLPLSLIHHINGNAVYNATDPVFNVILGQLEAESDTTGNAIPYDLRISQMVLEALQIEEAEFPSFENIADPDQEEALEFISNVEEPQNILQETNAIGNYASTVVVPEQLKNTQMIIHGAKVFERWDSEQMGRIGLVISDYSGKRPYDSMLEQLNSDSTIHPFQNILLITSFFGNAEHVEGTEDLPIQISYRNRNEDSSRDLCKSAQLFQEVEWFMIAGSFSSIRQELYVMTSDNRALALFADSVLSKCDSDEFCSRQLDYSKARIPDNDQVFRDNDMVFSRQKVLQYCADRPEDPSWVPSATEYAAFLKSAGKLDELYQLENRGRVGSRPPFLDNDIVVQDNRILQVLQNQTSCGQSLTSHDCVVGEHTGECEWVAQFSSCRDLEDVCDVHRCSPTKWFNVPRISVSKQSPGECTELCVPSVLIGIFTSLLDYDCGTCQTLQG